MSNANTAKEELPEYEHLDPEVLKRYERLEDSIRERALSLLETDDLEEADEAAHLLASVLIGVAYSILEDSGYLPRKVMERFLDTVEAAESGKLVFIEADTGVPN